MGTLNTIEHWVWPKQASNNTNSLQQQWPNTIVEFKNGDIVNKQGENEGSAMVLSYAALSEMDKDTTLKVRQFSSQNYMMFCVLAAPESIHILLM